MTWVRRALWTTILFLLHFLHLGSAMAITRHVPAELATIQAGLDASAAGDTVLLACDTYFESNLVMKSGVILRGESGSSDCAVIDAQNQGRILDCNNLNLLTKIEGITFRNGEVTEGWLEALGGGIRCLNSNIAISDCSFENNNSRIGAGFGADDSTIALTNCTFVSNSATHSVWSGGGAVWVRDCSGTISNCQAFSNTAFSTNPDDPGDGGAFFFNNSHIYVNHCLLQDNSTGAGAGGFYSVTNDSSVFFDCDFVANTAANGGAVYFEYGAAAQLINCTFTANTASSGGAVSTLNGSYPVINNCLFESNIATDDIGGAIEGWDSDFTISGSTFRHNSASNAGGAISFGGCNSHISNSLFYANNATNNGGGIFSHFSDVVATNCTLVSNSAVSGAGIYCGVDSEIDIDHSIIAFSFLGESLVGSYNNFATVSCCNFFGNERGNWVGPLTSDLHTNNNFSTDPLFCGLNDSDFGLFNISLCAPENQPDCGLVGAFGVQCSSSGPEARQLFINEFLASNSSGLQDETGDYEDWVEIFNPGDSPVNLAGLHLSNSIRNPLKWPMPDIELPAHEFLLVFCDNDLEDGPLHASFELEANNNDICLFDQSANQFCDSKYFFQQEPDISEGRLFDGHSLWTQYSVPTPGATNRAISNTPDQPAPAGMAAYNSPNPFNPSTTISFTINQPGFTTVSVYDIAGHQIRSLLNEDLHTQTHQLKWDGKNDSGHTVSAGIYFYRIVNGPSQITGRMALIK